MRISASGPSDFAHGGKGKTIFDPIFLFLARGNRRSAASGGNSKAVSRKRPDWRAV
jgi:hypothetical protein